VERVIVSVECEGKTPIDLDLPAELPASKLARQIAEAMKWQLSMAHQITALAAGDAQGRILYPNETLADVGAWDGSRLLMQPTGSIPNPTPRIQAASASVTTESTTEPVPAGGPVVGFRSLGIDLLDEDDEEATLEPDSEPRSSGFVWKQLD